MERVSSLRTANNAVESGNMIYSSNGSATGRRYKRIIQAVKPTTS